MVKLQSRDCHRADLQFCTYHVFSTQHHIIFCAVKYLVFPKRLSFQFLAFKDLYIQTKLCAKFLKEAFSKDDMSHCWILTSTNKCHKISPYSIYNINVYLNLIVIVAWLNFDQLDIIKWPKKIKLPQMRFFSEKKQLINFSCTFWSLLLCKINTKPESRSKVMRLYHTIFGPKWPNFCE